MYPRCSHGIVGLDGYQTDFAFRSIPPVEQDRAGCVRTGRDIFDFGSTRQAQLTGF